MATRVAAAGGGDWNTGASWVGGIAPTAADDAQIPATAGNMVIGAGAVCRSADFSTYTGTLSGTGTLTIGDATAGLSNIALKLVSGMTVSGPPVFSFVSTSATVQTVDFAGKTTGNVTFNATSNGSWQYTGAHTIGTTGTLTLTKGTLDINGQTCSWGLFTTPGTNCNLTLGSANITLTGASANVWVMTTGMTSFSGASSTISLTGASGNFSGRGTYGTVVFSGSTVQQTSLALTCTNCTITGPSNKTYIFDLVGTNLTCTGTFTCNGQSSINRIQITGNRGTVGTAKTITAATVSVTNTDFQDITGAGAGSWDFSARTDIGDCGGNSGITFPASVAQTWSGTSGGNWSTNGWTTRVPLPQDDVNLGKAFSASQTVTADMPRLGRSIDWTGATGSPTWSFASVANSIYGSLTLISGMTVSGTNATTFAGRSSYTITSAGKSPTEDWTFNAPGGTYTLNDALNATGRNLTITNGGLNTNSMTVASGFMTSSNSNVRSITLGTSTWNLDGTAATNTWDISSSTNMTLSASSSTIIFSSTTTNTRTYRGGGLTYGTLTYTVAGSTGELDITGSNSFAQINFSDASNARSLKFTKSTTTTIRSGNGFNIRGTSGKKMTLDTVDGAGTFTLTSPSRQASCDYITPTRSTVDASPAWYAGANSNDGGTTTNWLFAGAPSMNTGNGSGSNGIQSRMNLQNLRSLI